jgi:hypothetical protein
VALFPTSRSNVHSCLRITSHQLRRQSLSIIYWSVATQGRCRCNVCAGLIYIDNASSSLHCTLFQCQYSDEPTLLMTARKKKKLSISSIGGTNKKENMKGNGRSNGSGSGWGSTKTASTNTSLNLVSPSLYYSSNSRVSSLQLYMHITHPSTRLASRPPSIVSVSFSLPHSGCAP